MHDRFEHLLGTGERVHEAGSGTLVDGGDRGPVSVAVTDRRLLCVHESGGFLDVGLGGVCSVRSRARTRLTYRPHSRRLLLVAGYLLATLSFIAVVVLAADASPAATVVVPVVALAAACAVAGAELVALPGEATDRRRVDGGWTIGWTVGRSREALGDRVRASTTRELATFAAALVCLALLVVATLATAPLAAVPGLLGVAGVALVVYAQRRGDRLDGGVVRRRDLELVVHTVGGDAVRLRLAPDSDLGRELGRRARSDAGDAGAPSVT